jgi:hypothetical protein
MSQNKIHIYQRRDVLRVAYESRTVTEAITDAIGTVIDNLQRSSISLRGPAETIATTENFSYTRTTSSGPTPFPEAEGYGAQATVA